MSSSLADDVRQSATEAYGSVPNFLEAILAHGSTPGAVYVAADEALMDGVLSPVEQQAVLLAICAHHNSRYDSVAHARMALDAGLAPQVVDRLLAGKLPQDDRLRALVEATRQTYDERGWLDPETVQALEERGVGRGALYEIFALYGMKTFACFTNHITDPAIDAGLASTEDQLDNVPDEPSEMEMRRLVLG
jgi:alkylhydroperoxidase family enzyme